MRKSIFALALSLSCSCSAIAASLWSDAVTPGTTTATDLNPVEIGVKFTSEVNGVITGIRFFKGAGNTGTHTATLWTVGGAPLATATFTSETESEWQQVLFAEPVEITANTTYVASYYAPNGHYAATGSYFSNGGHDSAPLHAPSTAAANGNGVFKYGASSFPDQSFNATNYWVDVVFEANIP